MIGETRPKIDDEVIQQIIENFNSQKDDKIDEKLEGLFGAVVENICVQLNNKKQSNIVILYKQINKLYQALLKKHKFNEKDMLFHFGRIVGYLNLIISKFYNTNPDEYELLFKNKDFSDIINFIYKKNKISISTDRYESREIAIKDLFKFLKKKNIVESIEKLIDAGIVMEYPFGKDSYLTLSQVAKIHLKRIKSEYVELVKLYP